VIGDDTVTASAAPRETILSTGGHEVFVRERGDGHALLLINGLGGNVDMWGAAEERLSTVARTIAFDLPGTGRSSTARRPMSIAALAKLAAGVLDELGHERVDVLGFSLGGLIAQELAHEAPARIRRLALVATGCGWGSMPGSAETVALLSIPVRYHSRALYEHTKFLLSPADRELIDRLPWISDARLRHPPSLFGYTAHLWAGALWSSLTWLPTVRVPTLVIHGDGDQIVPPANSVQLARLLPKSRLHVLPREGHLLVLDPDGGTLPLLQDFFASSTLGGCRAWSTGSVVEDDETVERAFEASVGAQPYRALSDAYRRFVRSRHEDAA
jgi:pimeloyl-ACP methyl ester carboxylesterase